MKLPIYETSDTKLNIMLETILSQRRMPWFYEHFVNVELVGEYDMVFYFTDLETNKQLRPFWSTFGVLYYDEIHDETEALKVIDFALNKGAYCNIWVDKEFISGTDEYNVYKFFHPLLIFGKDEERNEYCAVNFTDSKGVFHHNISVSDLANAIRSVKSDRLLFDYYAQNGPFFEYFKVDNEVNKTDFSLPRFISELENYYLSRKAPFKEKNGGERFVTVYGIDIYPPLIRFFENAVGRTLPFKSLFDMRLHKKFLYDRLTFIRDNYDVSTDFPNIIDQIRRVYSIFDCIVKLDMKYCLKMGIPPNGIPQDKTFFCKVAELLREAELIERDALPKLLLELKLSPADKYNPVKEISVKGATVTDWDFSQNRTFQFVLEGDGINTEFDGGISLNLNGTSLNYIHRHVDIDASVAKNVFIEIISNLAEANVYFEFTTYENVDFSDNMSLKLNIDKIGECVTFKIDMNENNYWHGKILDVRVRVNSNSKTNGNIIIKKISIT